VKRAAAGLTLTALLAGCHDFAALSSHYGDDLGVGAWADLSSPSHPRDLTADGAGPGRLNGSGAATQLKVDLTSAGTIDWAHFGYPNSGDMDHKRNVSPQIGYYRTLSGYVPSLYTNDPVSFAWQDGTLTSMVSGTTTGMYQTGVGDGFQFTVPASPEMHTLVVYVAGYRSNGKLTASLSDHSAPDYSDASFSRSDDQIYDATYTLTFNAAGPGETLTVTWAAASVIMDGNVALQGAALR
jgi:hypothetical protein